jgi:multisubunit Na+/H+ antiporter MnhB subunit
VTTVLVFFLLWATIDEGRKRWARPEWKRSLRVVAGVYAAVAVLVVGACVAPRVAWTWPYAWWGVQFIGIEGPGFLIALAVLWCYHGYAIN